MKNDKVIASALIGTSLMTLFSYIVSNSKNKNFREPDILAKLIHGVIPAMDKPGDAIAGWSSHYAMGSLFAVIYNQIWKNSNIKPSIASGLLFGAASGVLGILAWKIAFELHPDPPAINQKKYLGHLMLAHLVFGASSAVGYNMFKDDPQFSLN